jgi:toxin ParE1/3/4
MTKIRWSEVALRDVRSLKRYIAQDSPFYARQFCERLMATVDKLAEFPQIGRRVPEADESSEEIRELIYRDYRILYWVEPGADCVQILAVIHGARDLAGMAQKPWQ